MGRYCIDRHIWPGRLFDICYENGFGMCLAPLVTCLPYLEGSLSIWIASGCGLESNGKNAIHRQTVIARIQSTRPSSIHPSQQPPSPAIRTA
ncbi:hypothetical protein G7K_3946-t1 [Saitoella complicata NRRL Y-17804]|uniref:Uncharacterized protein n=1 Tax=Saitoella complicata (strain BCRC 22490 / CBS 7301 / JCM 7358 / NBRC 10748 / NRRL Y-17804) TaxID=698492 RepID=A0A0E9NJC6_SAICN|nr:hypothetical protein G7K_3946-t1 [Saitoella complicata NRRL Y-17804]